MSELELAKAYTREWRQRAEAAEARVAELTARVGDLGAALRTAAGRLDLCAGKLAFVANKVIVDEAQVWAEEARAVLSGLSDEAKSGSPAPVGEALEAEQSWHNVRACPHCGALMPEVEPKAVIEAERAVIELAKIYRQEEGSTEQEMLFDAIDNLAKARKAGGE